MPWGREVPGSHVGNFSQPGYRNLFGEARVLQPAKLAKVAVQGLHTFETECKSRLQACRCLPHCQILGPQVAQKDESKGTGQLGRVRALTFWDFDSLDSHKGEQRSKKSG